MSHPFSEHRQHKVEKSRVGHITHGYASGGAIHKDAAEDRKMVKSMVKGKALKVHGKKSGGRLDRVARAKGGRVKGGKGSTHVHVNVLGGGGPPPPPAIPMAGGAQPMPHPMPPAMPPPGGMPGAASMLPPGAAPGVGQNMPPMQMPIRKHGGRAYAKSGAVKDGAAWKEGLRNGTPVSHTDGKNDTKNIVRGRQVTFWAGGKVKGIDDGAGSGPGRLEKIPLQKKSKRP